jgi:hypothetical protein
MFWGFCSVGSNLEFYVLLEDCFTDESLISFCDDPANDTPVAGLTNGFTPIKEEVFIPLPVDPIPPETLIPEFSAFGPLDTAVLFCSLLAGVCTGFPILFLNIFYCVLLNLLLFN